MAKSPRNSVEHYITDPEDEKSYNPFASRESFSKSLRSLKSLTSQTSQTALSTLRRMNERENPPVARNVVDYVRERKAVQQLTQLEEQQPKLAHVSVSAETEDLILPVKETERTPVMTAACIVISFLVFVAFTTGFAMLGN